MIPRFVAGESLSESRLNQLVEACNRIGVDANGNYSPYGTDAVVHSRMRGAARQANVQVRVARMKYDVIPRTQAENSWGDSFVQGWTGESPFDPNAVLQIWSDEFESWIDDDGQDIQVVTMGILPLLEDEIIQVVYDSTAEAWFPTETPRSAMIEITNFVPNADGLLEGKIKLWDSDHLNWYDGADVWVVDANRG